MTNWALDSDVESVSLDGPFAAGSSGMTISRSVGRIPWQIKSVRDGKTAVIEIPFPGAVIEFQWNFESCANGTLVTQTVTLEGPQATAFSDVLKASIPAGMAKLAQAMVEAAEKRKWFSRALP